MRIIAWQVWRKQLKPRHALEIINLSCNHHDSFRSDFEKGTIMDMYDIERTFCFIARNYLRMTRPWYKHPRFHVWHYNINVVPILNFKRWAFSRCAGCGKGFKWGYAPTSHQWSSGGPRWFRSEDHVYHSSCPGVKVPNTPTADAKPV